MTSRADEEPFVQRYLDPGDRLGEVLFGLLTTYVLNLGWEDPTWSSRWRCRFE